MPINNTEVSSPSQQNSVEFDSCAVGGFFTNGQNKAIDLVLQFMGKLPHRGGQIFVKQGEEIIRVGDGAGVACDIDWNYYDGLMAGLGIEKPKDKPCGIGNFFLPNDEEARVESYREIARICQQFGVQMLSNGGAAWRDIPFESPDSQVAKDLKLQKFQQCFLAPTTNMSEVDFEKALLKIHGAVEAYSHQLNQQYKADNKPLPRLAVASVSCRKVIYKGMLLPEEVKYFTDLQKSNPKNVVYHIRQSTNTSPSPGNAQPFYIIGHNGELNSVDGNADKNHKPGRGFSDSRTFDENLREFLLQGKDVIEAITTLMPPPKTGNEAIDGMLEDMRAQDLEYNGPAHMVFSVNGIYGAKMDSSALRPSRYLVVEDKDGQKSLYVGSEDMFSDEQVEAMGLKIIERSMLKAGEMIIIENGVVKKNQQILEELQNRYQKKCVIEEIKVATLKLPEQLLDLGEREFEIKKYQMMPLLGGAINKIAMGDDTNPLKTDPNDLPTLADHFKQKFSQVSSPPLDPEKERSSFYLQTYLGDKTADSQQKRHLYKIDSPVLKLGEFDSVKTKANDKTIEIDLTVDLESLTVAERDDEKKVFALIRDRIRKICDEVEAQVRAGKSIIILDGSGVSAGRMGVPDILVMGAVHSHLHKKDLDRKASIIVNSAQAESAHHVSVLLALGACAVSPVGFYDFSAHLVKRDKNPEQKYQQYCADLQHGIEKAHLSTMAKYGITSAMTYSSARLVESLTLNLGEVSEEYDPSCLGNAFRSVRHCSGFMGKFNVDDVLSTAVISHQRRYNNQIISAGRFAYSPHGVDHAYNANVVRAMRSATTAYRAKRSLVEDLRGKTQELEKELGEIKNNTAFDFAAHRTKLETEKSNFEKQIKAKNRKIVQLENQNDKLFNSLFFIDGIAKQLGAIIKGDKEQEEKLLAKLKVEVGGGNIPRVSSVASYLSDRDIEDLASSNLSKADKLLMRQFLSVVNNSGRATPTDNFSEICQQYRDGVLDFTGFKKALFEKAGYDVSQLEQIEEWGKLIGQEKPIEAAQIFAKLSEQNTTRIKNVYEENEKNQNEIAKLKQEVSDLSHKQTINNILLDVANSGGGQDYAERIDQKIDQLKAETEKYNLLPDVVDGAFDKVQMDDWKIDEHFASAMADIVQNKQDFRVTIADNLEIIYPKDVMEVDDKDLQKVSDITANHFVTGGMSHGALTLLAHNDVAKAAQLIGSKACTGEGGKPDGQFAMIVQIASGRFGINIEYFADANTVEIKIVQGAKPGEGGMLPAGKVSEIIAAVRGAIVGIGLISPPPHHDIYSIEDLQELIKDLKELKPGVNVAVKLCASSDIEQIAIGVAKSGADIINIAGGSGGTGAAAVDSIKSTGLSSEVGLVMVHNALSKAGIRDLVKLQVSGFPNTPEGVITMAILGGDILESGTTDLIALGCDMHRKCNIPGACVPGITNNEKGYQGHAEDLALYKLNMAKAVQELLKKLGVRHLKELRGRVDLLSAEHLKDKVTAEFIENLLAESNSFQQLPPEVLEGYKKQYNETSNKAEYQKLLDDNLESKIASNEKAVFNLGRVDVTNRAFGAGLAFKYYKDLEKKSADHITIKTSGVVGQSYGAFNTHGLCLEHTGSVQDGFGKSMSGGILVVKQPESEKHLTNSIYVGNAAFYGASAGRAFIPGVGNRCAVLMKGATLVVNGNVGDYACEYMTSGSFLALGEVGRHFGSGMSGGVAVLYNQNAVLAEDAKYATEEEAQHYHDAIRELLEEDYSRTGDEKINEILRHYKTEKSKFKIVLPKSLDKIKTLKSLEEIEASFALRYNVKKYGDESTSIFEKVWLKIKRAELEQKQNNQPQAMQTDDEVIEMCSRLAPLVENHIEHMTHYTPLAARIVGGLGMPDQALSDNVEELMDELIGQSKKCRGCDASSCAGDKTPTPKQAVSGCPINKEPNSINSILKGEGDYAGMPPEEMVFAAFKKQIEQSPFAGFTGSACPAPCQDACTQSVPDAGNAEAVKIKRIELLLHKLAVLNGWYDKLEVFKQPMPAENQKKIMIIGSGPASLEAAYHLALAGHKVEIFEKSDKVGGLLRYGIPDHKLQKDTIDFYTEKLRAMGVNFHLETEVNIHQIKTNYPHYNLYLDGRGLVAKAFDEQFPKTNVEEGGNHSMAMDFLSYCNQYYAERKEGIKKTEAEHPFIKFNLGKKVAVLGSADTAEDVKRTIIKLNDEFPDGDLRRVELVAINRQPQESDKAKPGTFYPMPRDVSSSDLAREVFNTDNVQHHDDTSPNKFIVNESGKIKAVQCDKTYSLAPEFSRNIRPESRKIEEIEIACDSVITAIGFKAPELAQGEMREFGAISEKTIVPIGDIATKTGFIKDGNELIVSAQANAKKVAKAFIEGISPGRSVQNSDMEMSNVLPPPSIRKRPASEVTASFDSERLAKRQEEGLNLE